MTDLGTKFPALGGVDRLRLVERAWGQGYRWWVKAARALQAQAVAAYDRKHVQPNGPARPSVGETDLGQEQEERETTRRKLPQRIVSPVIQVTETGEITVAGIKKGKRHHRRQPRRAAQTGTDRESINPLQNVYGDHETVSELRHVSTAVRLRVCWCSQRLCGFCVRRSCIVRRLPNHRPSCSRPMHDCASSLVRARSICYVSHGVSHQSPSLLKVHAGRAAGRPESRGEYLERNYGAGDTYSYGATGTYDNDATLQIPVSSATVARRMATINVHPSVASAVPRLSSAHV
eukprot:COSAG02_NODE_5024_length_4719_cov_13.040693_5_plen_290_part_00